MTGAAPDKRPPLLAWGGPLKAEIDEGCRIAPGLAARGAACSGSGNGIGLASATAVVLGLAGGRPSGRGTAALEPRRSTGFTAGAGAVGAAEAVCVCGCLSFAVNRLPRNFFVASTSGTDAAA